MSVPLLRALSTKAQSANADYTLALQTLIDQIRMLQQSLAQDLPQLLATKSTDTKHFDPAIAAFKKALTSVGSRSQIKDIHDKKKVAFGGAFSAGKSSLINAVIGERRLVVEIDPTTSIPTYVCAGEKERIRAVNLFQKPITLKPTEFTSLTHDERTKFGTDIGGLLRTVVIQIPSFGWRHLALLDTPGYSKPTQEQSHERTDADIAYEQLNSADYIVWVVSAAAGIISEDELAFLARLNADIPKLVVLNRADSKPAQDLADIQALIKRTLQQNKIDVAGVVTASARKPKDYPLTGLIESLDRWNQPINKTTQTVPQKIKAVLGQLHEQVRYAHYEMQHLAQMLEDDTTQQFVTDERKALVTLAKQQQELLVDAENELKNIEAQNVLYRIDEFVELVKQQIKLNREAAKRQAQQEALALKRKKAKAKARAKARAEAKRRVQYEEDDDDDDDEEDEKKQEQKQEESGFFGWLKTIFS